RDTADCVRGELAHAARLLANTRVNSLQSLEGEHPLLDITDRAILLVEGEIAACMHDHLPIIRLDFWKQLYPVAELPISRLHREQQECRERQRGAGMAQRKPHGSHVRP